MTWTTNELYELAAAQDDWVVEREGEVLSISNDEGLDAYIYAGEKQVVIETALFPADAVRDTAELNQLILETHQLVPLSTIGISVIGGDKYYVAFGSLSSASKPEVVIEEIETLFANTPEFLDLFSQYLNLEDVA